MTQDHEARLARVERALRILAAEADIGSGVTDTRDRDLVLAALDGPDPAPRVRERDGRRFVETGEVREPKEGEWFVAWDTQQPRQRMPREVYRDRIILRELPPEPARALTAEREAEIRRMVADGILLGPGAVTLLAALDAERAARAKAERGWKNEHEDRLFAISLRERETARADAAEARLARVRQKVEVWQYRIDEEAMRAIMGVFEDQ